MLVGFGLQAQDFKEVAQAYQSAYMGGAQNCDAIMNSMDEDIKMSELLFSEPLRVYTFKQLKEFCPHLPKKDIIQSTTEQRLLTPTLMYDYVSQTFLRSSGEDMKI